MMTEDARGRDRNDPTQSVAVSDGGTIGLAGYAGLETQAGAESDSRLTGVRVRV
jgi:hypothetical protein